MLAALAAKIALNHRINVELEGRAKLLYDYWFVQYDFPLSAAQAAALGKPRLAGKPYRSSGGPMVYHDHLKRDIPKGCSTEFIYYTLNHLMKTIEQNVSGSTFKEVSAGTLKSIQTQLPAPAVLSEFSKLMQPIFSQQDTLEQQNQELTTLRDWLLPMLMNGQVRVEC